MNNLVLYPAFLSFEEITIIMIVAVIIFGPKKIPEIARGLGEGMRKMKEATDDIKREIMTPIEESNPVADIKKTIDSAKQEISEPLVKDLNVSPLEEQKPSDESEAKPTSLDDIIGPVTRNK